MNGLKKNVQRLSCFGRLQNERKLHLAAADSRRRPSSFSRMLFDDVQRRITLQRGLQLIFRPIFSPSMMWFLSRSSTVSPFEAFLALLV